jgi:hypothetical protein
MVDECESRSARKQQEGNGQSAFARAVATLLPLDLPPIVVIWNSCPPSTTHRPAMAS